MAELLWKRGTTLGQGGFGVVSLASTSNALFHGVTLPSLIAVKSCNYSDSQSLKEEEEFLGMFKHSPCIIRSFGANLSFEDEVIIYNLLLEYASGGSLANRLRNCNSLPEFEVKKHTKNVLLGLSCIHTNGIIHCDIKPDNILLVGTEETAKIADFGLSMTFEQAVKEKQELMIRGTKRYMAPELVLNYDYGPHVDIWALGCTVYELITGIPLWDGDDDHVLHQITFEKPKFQNSKLSKEAKDFLKRCLVKNPSSRWTADVLLNHPFLQNSSIVLVNTAKTRKKKSGSKSLLHKPIRKITFKFGNHKFVRQLPDLKEVENETCGRVLGTDK
uniref:ATP binding protein n=1 Tax=Solanum tuberosum TaxID=4113 RepID=M1BTU8_SOLTU